MVEVENHTLHLLREIRSEQVEMRRDNRSLTELVVGMGQNAARQMTRLERSVFDLRAELELTIKMEVGGGLAGAESRLEGSQAESMTEIQSRLDVLEAELLDLRERVVAR